MAVHNRHDMSDPQYSVFANPRVVYDVIYADSDFMVVSKPAGLTTQPGLKHERNALLNGLFVEHGKQLQNLGKVRDFGLIHRLDKPTSGLVVVGLSREGYDGIRSQFEKRTIEKSYLAAVHGAPNPPKGTESTPIREVRKGARKRAELGGGRGARPASTAYEVIARSRSISLVLCRPKTGRLHQIRVHMAHRGCPVIGDRDYGKKSPLDRSLGRDMQWLHAARLRLKHPRTGKWMEFKARVPEDLKVLLSRAGVTCPRHWR